MNKLTKAQEKRWRKIIDETMQGGVDSAFGGDGFKSEEWNKRWGEKKYDETVSKTLQHLADELVRQKKEIIEEQMEKLREMEVNKTLVAIPKGYQFVEVRHIGKIKTKAIKKIPTGAEYHTMHIDEIVDDQAIKTINDN